MKCEIMRGERVIAAQAEFSAEAVRAIVRKQGADASQVPDRLMRRVDIGTIRLYPVREVAPVLARFEVLADAVRTVEADAVVYTYGKRTQSLAEAKALVKRQIASAHDRYESGRVEYQGIWIKFDLEARINAAGLADSLASGEIAQSEWRGRLRDERRPRYTDVATLPIASAEAARALKDAIVAAVNNGFTAKAALEQAVNDAADLETLLAIDISGPFGLNPQRP